MSTSNLFHLKPPPSFLSSPVPKISLSFLSPLLLPSSIPSFSLQFPHSSRSISNLAVHKPFSNTSIEEFEEEEGEDEEMEVYESDSEDYSIDIDELEEEAEDVVRQYSTSLSRLLRIGCFLILPNFVIFLVTQLRMYFYFQSYCCFIS